MTYIEIAIRFLLIAIFLPSAVGKLINRAKFKQGVLDYQILPTSVAYAYSMLLPWIEMALCIVLFLGIALRIAALVITLLLVSFIVALAVNIVRRRILECHCYGIFGSKAIGWGTIVRNIVLVILALILFMVAADPYTLNDWLMKWTRDLPILLSIDGLLPLILIIAASLVILALIEEGINLRNQFSNMDLNV